MREGCESAVRLRLGHVSCRSAPRLGPRARTELEGARPSEGLEEEEEPTQETRDGEGATGVAEDAECAAAAEPVLVGAECRWCG